MLSSDSLSETTSSCSPTSQPIHPDRPSRYESQKRRDWNTFGQYLRNHRPPLTLSRCSGAHVLEFLRYLDQFGKTKVHVLPCPFFGHPHPPAPCPCPLKQAWGSLDALVGRLRAAFEENGGQPEANPFGARAVRLYLREVRDSQAKARGIAYEKKKRKKTSSNHHSNGSSNSSSNTTTAAAVASFNTDNGMSISRSENYGMGGGQYGNFMMGMIGGGGAGGAGEQDVIGVVDGFNYTSLSVFN